MRLRVADGHLIGTTAFFRNRPYIQALGQEIAEIARSTEQVNVLVHACSIGAEVYSLAIQLRLAHPDVRFRISATDISKKFRDVAERGRYPATALHFTTDEERRFFDLQPDGSLAVGDDVRDFVRFEAPASYINFNAPSVYHVVTLCNALIYVPAPKQALAIRQVAEYNSHVLALTGGHHDTVADDLSGVGYEPIMTDFKKIHAGWADRRRPEGWTGDEEWPPNIYADPLLGPIDDLPGWRYRHGTLFRKRAVALAA